MKRIFYLSTLIVFLFAACSSGEVKDKANKAGKEAGQVIGEFATGISSGVEESVQVNVVLSEDIKNRGIQFGKTLVTSVNEGKDNNLSLYIIFNQDYKGTITAKAFDNKERETGRTKVDIVGKKDEARFINFQFDKLTNIDNDSKITIE